MCKRNSFITLKIKKKRSALIIQILFVNLQPKKAYSKKLI